MTLSFDIQKIAKNTRLYFNDFTEFLNMACETTWELHLYHTRSTYEKKTSLSMNNVLDPQHSHPTSDIRSDLYELGLLFYYCLTQTLPKENKNKTLNLKFEMNQLIPKTIIHIIEKLCSYHPDDRYQSALGLHDDLIKCLENWKKTGKIKAFFLGETDTPQHLRFTNTLYGRSIEQKMIHNTLEDILKGDYKAILIKGEKGCGKSRLIRDCTQIFQSKILTIDQTISPLKKEGLDIQNTLNNALDNLLIKLKIDKKLTWNEKINILSNHKIPLIVLIEDIQWLKKETFLFMIQLIKNKTPYIGILLTTSPCFLEKEIEKKTDIEILSLRNLTPQDVSYMIQDLFNAKKEDTLLLSKIVHKKTNGNPGFIIQFLQELNQEKKITYKFKDRKWHWDHEILNKTNVTENVAHTRIEVLKSLPQKTQHILQFAACIGVQFKLIELSEIIKLSKEELELLLWTATQKNILIEYSIITNSIPELHYKFSHPLIQEKCYSSIHPGQIQNYHFKICHYYIEKKPPIKDPLTLYQAATQILKAEGLATKSPHHKKYSTLLLAAATEAIQSGKKESAQLWIDACKRISPGQKINLKPQEKHPFQKNPPEKKEEKKESKLTFIQGAMIAPIKYSLPHGLYALNKSIKYAIKEKNESELNNALSLKLYYLYLSSASTPRLNKEITQAIQLIKKNTYKKEWQHLHTLLNYLTNPTTKSEKPLHLEIHKTKNYSSLIINMGILALNYQLKNHMKVIKISDTLKKETPLTEIYIDPILTLFKVLALCQYYKKWNKLPPKNQQFIKKTQKESKKKLKDTEPNTLHIYLTIQAEIEALKENNEEAQLFYESALFCSRKNKLSNLLLILYERSIVFYTKLNKEKNVIHYTSQYNHLKQITTTMN